LGVTVRVGFYGAGFIASLHTWLLNHSGQDHRIAAVHDPDPARAEAFARAHGAVQVGEDELLDEVDLVYVTTWTSEHPRLVAKVAAAGRALFCEKPLAVDADTAAAMVDAVRRAGITNQVGLILRSAPAFVVLRDLLGRPEAGRVLAVVFRDDQYIPNQGIYASTWRVDPAKAGRGTLLEHSIHDVDILRWMLGPVTEVSGVTREVHGFPGIDDVAVATLRFEGGPVAALTSVWHDVLERPSLRRVEVFCERMHAVAEHELTGPVRWQVTGTAEQVLEGRELLAEAARIRAGAEHASLPAGGVLNPAAELLAAVAAGRPAVPDLAEALPAHRIVDAIYRSAELGGSVVADPEGDAVWTGRTGGAGDADWTGATGGA
jgi:predicted dehydrogenase